jgi:alpha-galactosidase
MPERIILVGAGSAVFTRGLVADLIERQLPVELALVDIDPEALDIAERLAAKMIAARRAPITLSAATERRQVLPSATAVVCTVGVGGRDAWERDVYIPRRYGIFAPVGDTVGPGGTSRALRMIPAMVAVARDVMDLAPEALFFNYGNPMAPVCRAIRKVTGAQVIGLCHGVDMTGRYLADALSIPLKEMHYTAVGINHLTWFVEVRHTGRDLMPRLRELAKQRAASPTDDPFSWQLLQLFGAFPAVLDRHVTEFFPQFFRDGRYYGRILGVDAFSFEETIERGNSIFAEMRDEAYSPHPLDQSYFDRIGGEHERVLEIIDAIRHERPTVFSANLPNAGQAPNLPPDAVVETPAVAAGNGLRAIVQQPLSPALAGTLLTRYMWVETVVEAALEGSREKFIQALVLDGAVSTLETAEALADELITAQSQYLQTPDLIASHS